MIFATIGLFATLGFDFLAAPNVSFDEQESKRLSDRNFRSVQYYTVNWPYGRFLMQAKAELSDQGWTIDDQSDLATNLTYFDRGDWEMCYFKPSREPLATFTIYPSTPKGRELGVKRREFVAWLENYAKDEGFTLEGIELDDNTILFPFGVSKTLFYIGGGRHAPFKIYRFDVGSAKPTWSVSLGPISKEERSKLVGTLFRYLGNANNVRTSSRNEKVLPEIPNNAYQDLVAVRSYAHIYRMHGNSGVQSGYIEPSGIPHYINFDLIGRDYQSPWAEEKMYASQP